MKMTRFLVLVVMAAMTTGAGAVDLDKLKKFEEKVKKATGQETPKEQTPAKEQASPKEQAPAVAQDASAPQLPAIPPIGNVPEADEVKIGRHIAGTLLGAAPLGERPRLTGLCQSRGPLGRH